MSEGGDYHWHQVAPMVPFGDPVATHDTSKLMRKRELDRKNQRIARDRTRARMAYLEHLVEELKGEDMGSRVKDLNQQLEDIKKERDSLVKMLQNKNLTSNDLSNNPSPTSADEKINITLEGLNGDSLEMPVEPEGWGYDMTPSNTTSTQTSDRFHSPYPQPQVWPTNPNNFCKVTGSFEVTTSSWNGFQDIYPPGIADNGTAYQSNMFSGAPIAHFNSQPDAWSPPGPSIEHHVVSSATTGVHPRQMQRNLWQLLFTIMEPTQSTGLKTLIAQEDIVLGESIAIQAVFNGWGTVIQHMGQHPALDILRKLDEAVFSPCAQVERLAIMLGTYRLLHYQIGGDRNGVIKVPPWYPQRHTDVMTDPNYTLQFMCWPGLRQKFATNGSRYFEDIFWDTWCSSFKLLWPYEMRDCFHRNVQSNLYQLSSAFNDSILDLKCMAMGPDMFRKYPEFYSDVIAIDQIPPTISNKHIVKAYGHNRRQFTHEELLRAQGLNRVPYR